ncbi:MAG: hypothetical protein OHK0046_51740 [Anaerolineae bacterium]
MQPIIEVNDVSKRYAPIGYRPSLRHEGTQLLKRALGMADKASWERDAFWALKNVNFTVKPGEGVAIVGRNGAGKTTLLRIISGILEPSNGHVSVRGRFSTLIGLGAGFDMERTGRENIFLNSAIFGFQPKQVSGVMDEIIDFAELGAFIDQPVKHYSSGMIARLGFSIAIHILPDMVFLDEVLSVGDAAFQKKCMTKMLEFKDNGCTFLFVSHAASQIKLICERAIWLHHGEMLMDGPVDEVVGAYEERFSGPE